MKKILPRRQTVFSFIVGWIMLIFLFILTATQFNLAEIAALGLNVPFADRLATTAQDLVGGLPLIATIFGFGFLIAMPVTGIIARWVKSTACRTCIGGFVGVSVTLFALKALFAITPIGAARDMTALLPYACRGHSGLCLFSAQSARAKSARLIFQPTRMQKRLGIAAWLFAPLENQIASRGKGD